MSDQYDVENALADLLAAVVYPAGSNGPSAAGFPVKIYPGWPTTNMLDDDLAAGVAHISIFDTNTERNTTRYPRDWQQQSVNPATITLGVSGQTVTVGGAMPSPYSVHNLALLMNGLPYTYQVLAGDTLASIAIALAAQIPGATAVGNVITLPSSSQVSVARVGTTGTSVREVKRQERVYQITIWANTPLNRSTLAKLVDPELAATDFLAMPDGYAARLKYRGSKQTDALQKALLYRLDLNYSVEYATTQTDTNNTQVTVGQVNASSQADGSTQYGPVTTTYS